MIFFGFFVYNFFFHCLTELMLCYFIQTACMNIYTCVVGDMISGHMTSGLDIWTPYIWTLQIAVCHGVFFSMHACTSMQCNVYYCFSINAWVSFYNIYFQCWYYIMIYKQFTHLCPNIFWHPGCQQLHQPKA